MVRHFGTKQGYRPGIAAVIVVVVIHGVLEEVLVLRILYGLQKQAARARKIHKYLTNSTEGANDRKLAHSGVVL